MRNIFAVVIAVAAMCFMSAGARAIPVAITGYDVISADPSGFGGWSYTYSGTVTPTGATVSLTGGTGTMADGVLAGTTVLNSQLFDVAPEASVITLYFDQTYSLNTMEIYGGDHGAVNNSIPGALSGFDLTIGGSTASLQTVGFGPTSVVGPKQINGRADIAASALAGISASSVTLFGFTSSEFPGPILRFSIAEIVIDGNVITSSVPEPAALSLLGIGLVGIAGLRRRRRISGDR